MPCTSLGQGMAARTCAVPITVSIGLLRRRALGQLQHLLGHRRFRQASRQRVWCLSLDLR
jgi:hypothetical protein